MRRRPHCSFCGTVIGPFSEIEGLFTVNSGEPPQRHGTAPILQACRLAVTLSNENALSRFRASDTASVGLRAAAGRSWAGQGSSGGTRPLH